MKREPVSHSKVESGNGTQQPQRILNLADSEYRNTATKIGFALDGNEYNQNTSWIACEIEDLRDVER